MKSNEWLTLGSHLILKKWCDASDRNFQKQFNALETTQRQILHSILQTSTFAKNKKVQNYEQFVKAFPATRYSAWREDIQRYREQKLSLSSSKLVRFQPTSGSSEQIKFIPYTKLGRVKLEVRHKPPN